MGRNTLEPKIGDRKIINGDECIYIPDPWSYYVSYPCWCKISALEAEGYLIRKEDNGRN